MVLTAHGSNSLHCQGGESSVDALVSATSIPECVEGASSEDEKADPLRSTLHTPLAR